jgi:TolA-binding protein
MSTAAGARLTAALLAALLFAPAAHATAEDGDEVDLAGTPSQDLYLKKRPPTGASIPTPGELEPLLKEKEELATRKRLEAIKLLEDFLATNPTGDAAAEGLFKLAELYWEEARRQFVLQNSRYEQEVEACRQRQSSCKGAPALPKLDLSKAEVLYKRLVDDFPNFRRIDLCIYLLGFSAYEDGRQEEGLTWFQRVIDEHPDSTLVADSWMMVGEYYFGVKNDWGKARDAYAHVLTDPDAPTYDLALFKSAWCDWKLGDTMSAAKRFKQVLDLAAEAEKSQDPEKRKRRAQLRNEALEYLIVVFTEDDKVTAKDAYEFLAEIGGERYSREVITKLADTFYGQTRYDRAIEAYRFLIDLDPLHPDDPKFRIAIIESYLATDNSDGALAEAKKLAEEYGEGSPWAKANKGRPKAIRRAYHSAESALRTLGKRFHADAQSWEQRTKKPDLERYKRAASVYEYYLAHFVKDPHAVEIRYLRAEILFFKLGENEEAGDEYLAVGKTAPVGKFHKDALLKAMAAFEKARPKGLEGQRKLTPVDLKFAEAVDLYATLFPADPEIVDVIFRNGKMFYDYGNYDEAVKRFGLIVTKYPDHPNAGSAGDYILDALVKGEDYQNVEKWSRELKKAKAFQSPEQQKRLDKLIADAIGKAADKFAENGKYDDAAKYYMRIADEYPKDARAPTAIVNAGATLEKAKQPEKAASTYLEVQKRYPKSKEAPKATFAAAQTYEQMAYYDKAADAYAIVAYQYPDDPQAPDALYNAGALQQAQGRPKEAIKHYEAYAKRYREERKDAEDVAFRVGVVYEEAGENAKAAEAFERYVGRWKGGKYTVEAHARAARNFFKLGREKQTAEEAAAGVRAWKALSKDKQKKLAKWGAESRYLEGELIFKDYERVTLNVKPKALKAQLDKKTSLLLKAQEIYVQVVEFGDAQWATAALFRIGQMFENFANELKNAQVPKELTPEEQEVYRQELDTYVVDIEDKAIEAYKAGYGKALELKVYNEYTRQIHEALMRLSSSEFPPENEVRPEVRTGDRPPEVPLVKDVTRDEE